MGNIKCFVCSADKNLQETIPVKKEVVVTGMVDECGILNSHLKVIFLLRKIVELPQDVCCKFLQDYGDPCLWIKCCDSCFLLVEKSYGIFEQIQILQQKYQTINMKIKNSIRCSIKSVESGCCDFGAEREVSSYLNEDFEELVLKTEDEFEQTENIKKSVDNVTRDENEPDDLFISPLYSISEPKQHFDRNISLNLNSSSDEEVDAEKGDPLWLAESDSSSGSASDEDPLESESNSEAAEGDKIENTAVDSEKLPRGGRAPGSCKICGKTFKRARNIKRHLLTHTGKKLFECDICKRTFRKSGYLKLHREVHSRGRVNGTRCEICGKVFAHYSNLRKHLRGHTEGGPFKCDICGMSVKGSRNFVNHKNRHVGDAPLIAGNKNENSKNCGSQDQNNATVDAEAKSSSLIKQPKKCEECGKEFSTVGNFKFHMAKVHNVKPQTACDICGKECKKVSALEKHLRVHSGERPFKCQICGQCFKQGSSLNIHKMIHSGKKPCKCDICGKTFRENKEVNIHRRTHTGETPYACDLCPKRFVKWSGLKYHKVAVHSSQFSCDDCGKHFTTLNILNRHIRVHNGENSLFECEQCGKTFKTIVTLKNHKLVHAGEILP